MLGWSRWGLQGNCSCQMYSLEDLLNTQGKGSVTSGPRIWVKKRRANTKLCKLKILLIKKIFERRNASRKWEVIYERLPRPNSMSELVYINSHVIIDHVTSEKYLHTWTNLASFHYSCLACQTHFQRKYRQEFVKGKSCRGRQSFA